VKLGNPVLAKILSFCAVTCRWWNLHSSIYSWYSRNPVIHYLCPKYTSIYFRHYDLPSMLW